MLSTMQPSSARSSPAAALRLSPSHSVTSPRTWQQQSLLRLRNAVAAGEAIANLSRRRNSADTVALRVYSATEPEHAAVWRRRGRGVLHLCAVTITAPASTLHHVEITVVAGLALYPVPRELRTSGAALGVFAHLGMHGPLVEAWRSMKLLPTVRIRERIRLWCDL